MFFRLVWVLFFFAAALADRLEFVTPEVNTTYPLAADQALPVVFNVTRTDGTPFNLSTPVGFVLMDLIDGSDDGHVVLAVGSLNASTSFFVPFAVGGTYSLSSWHISEADAIVHALIATGVWFLIDRLNS